jgi:hypothetical protein
MNWSDVPILTVIVVGVVGVCLMVAAYILVALQGGGKQAMRGSPDARWSLPRRLLFAGASLGVVFGLAMGVLFLIPGGIPWTEGSDRGVALISGLTSLLAVWYFVIRRPQAPGRHSEGARARPDG